MRDCAAPVMLFTRGRRLECVIAAATVLVTIGLGCGAGSDRSVPASPRGVTTGQLGSNSTLRVVGTPDAILTYPPPDGTGAAQLRVGFRLNRSIGVTARGNAQARVDIEGVLAEFVSRVGRKRAYCYLAAPIDAPERISTAGSGARVRFVVRAAGKTLRATATVRSETQPDQLERRPRACAGRKER